jgi:adenylate kinase
MRMIFLGPPAVGKGTHAGMVAEHYKIPKVSTGEMLREEMKAGTDLGRKAGVYVGKGELVPDSIVIGMLRSKLSSKECSKGYILDGFPRTLEQARSLEDVRMDLVVNMVAAKGTLMARMTNRWTCSECQAIYNTLFVKPRKTGVCDACGGKLYQRDDQKPEVVEERLRVYERQTAPLIAYYRKKGILMDVSAEGEKAVVHERILSSIQGYFRSRGMSG